MRRRTLLLGTAAAPLAGCNEGARPVAATPEAAADPAAPIPAGFSERLVPLPLGSGGAPVSLRILLNRPPGAGPHPLLVLHHGSTGRGNDPSRFGQVQRFDRLVHAFLRAGWLVALPQRRGRGGSGGDYAEGLGPRGYVNDPLAARAGFQRAIADARASTDWLLSRPEVDATRVILAGHSRGGILALGQAAQHPPAGLRGTINFVGGWLAEGFDAFQLDRGLFREAGRARAPALFLYGADDTFYTLDHSRANFEAFRAGGGTGTIETFSLPPGSIPGGGRPDGHALIFVPDIWMPAVGRFLADLGLPAPA